MSAPSATAPLIANPPPRDLSSRLRKTEHLLWWSRGRGSTIDRAWILTTLVAVLLVAVILFVAGLRDRPLIFFLFAPFLGLAVSIPWRVFIAARQQIYGLTNERLLLVKTFPFPDSLSLGRDGASRGAIHMLSVTGGRARGNLRLQRPFALRFFWHSFGPRLIGIEDPLKITALIQSTLNLPIKIEDKTK